MRKLSEEDERFICESCLTLSSRELAEKLKVPRGTIMSAWRRNSIVIPPELAKQRKLEGLRKAVAEKNAKPHPADEAIRKLYLTVPVKTLAAQLHVGDTWLDHRMKVLGLVIPPEVIEQRKMASRIKPGNIPANKGKKQIEYMSPETIERTKATRFKKGEPNHNELYDGAITIRHEHPERGKRTIKYIRLAKGKWEQLQIYNWEKVNGAIPKGYVLACLSDDTLNCDPSNWKLMTMADNMLRNSASANLTDSYIANTIVGRGGSKELRSFISQIPELIETKRLQLQLKRTLKSKIDGTDK